MIWAKRFLVVISFCIIGSIPIVAHAQNTSNFSLESFDARYNLTKDVSGVSQMAVDEYIVALFPNYNQNHGILRAIPKTYGDNNLSVSINSVTKSASPAENANTSVWPYTSNVEKGNLILKIGDANNYVTGPQAYHISYNLSNVIKQYPDHDELYWNVNGVQWAQPVSAVSATLTMTQEIADASGQLACYTGPYGVKGTNCTITKQGTLITATTTAPLAAYENLSIVVSFKPGTFVVHKQTFLDKYLLAIIGICFVFIMPIASFFLMFTKWRKFGRDPKGRGTIIAEYQPPKETSLLINNIVLFENGSSIAVTAQLINLAVRGYVRIIDNTTESGKKSTDFSIALLKEPLDLTAEESQALHLFFGENSQVGTKVNISDLKNTLSKKLSALTDTLSNIATESGYFNGNPQKIRGKYSGLGGTLFTGGIIAIIIAAMASFIFIGFVGAGLVLSGLVVFAFAKAMPARTQKGVELHDYLFGLKLYIKMAEQERIRFHQSPDNAERKRFDAKDPAQMVKLFESLLPYAMIFGMEKQWAKEFEQLYITPPDWYSGNWNTFSTAYLIGGLGSFNTTTATSFSPPASSGGSGFSGGGFSGGGGGGGGGGGW